MPIQTAPAAAGPLHLLGHFDGSFAGAEKELPDLAHLMKGRRETRLWSDVDPGPALAQQGVKLARAAEGEFPSGGTMLIGGVHVTLSQDWLRLAKPRRVVLRYNLPNHARLFDVIEQIRAATGLDPELRFAAPALQGAVSLPGEVEPSLIPLDSFLVRPAGRSVAKASHEPFTVGRVSRDVPEKHSPQDPALYRLMALRGMRVRIMGGMCLKEQLDGVEGIELLPAGTMDVAEFYRGLDAVVYRTGSFTEPYGRVVWEALASGLPVVASSRGGYADFLAHDENCLIVHAQEDTWDGVQRLASDAALCERLGRAGRERAMQLHGPEGMELMVQDYLR